MIREFFIVLLLFVINPLFSQEALNRNQEQLRGSVKSLYETITFVFENTDKESDKTIKINRQLSLPNEDGQIQEAIVYRNQNEQNLERNRMNDRHLTFNKNGQVIKKTYYHADGKIRKTQEFNEKGSKILEQENNAEGKIISRMVYLFDKDNKMIEMKKYDDEEELEYRHLFSYINGKLTKDEKFKKLNDYLSEKIYSYDNNGNLIAVEAKDIHKNTEWAIQYTYNNNAIIKLVSLNNEGRINYVSTYNYDEKGNKLEEVRTKENGDIIYKYQYKYDKQNRKIEESEFDTFEWLTRKKTFVYHKKGYLEKEYDFTYKDGLEVDDLIVYVYNHEKRIIQNTTFDSSGEKLIEKTYKFNNKGQEILSTYTDNIANYHLVHRYSFNGKGNLSKGESKRVINNKISQFKIHYEYQYDKKGNWTKMVRYENGAATLIKNRKIEYF